MPKVLCIRNARLVGEDALVTGDLWISGGKIVSAQDRADEVLDAKGCYLAPGFIDIQLNGAYGVDFTREPQGVERVARDLPQHGVTAFCPTVITSAPVEYTKILPHLHPREVVGGAAILGAHLEGPFLSPIKKGCHDASLMLGCERGLVDLMDCYGTLDGVRIVTLAPELKGSGVVIHELTDRGILVCAGHSNATLEEAQDSFQQGISCVTHLFNACSGMHHRAPGLPGAALTNKKIYYGIIGDGYHVNPAVVNLVWQAHPRGFILVSDGISALGMPPGKYRLGDLDVEVDGHRATLEGTDTLAGSIAPLDHMVRLLRASTGCTVPQAIATVTRHPAELLEVLDLMGTLAEGTDADLVLLDEDLKIMKVWVRGDVVGSYY